MQKTDSLAASLIWGRIGAAVLALVAFILGLFGYSMSADEQAAAVSLIGAIITAIAGALALVSKIRERSRVAKE